MTSGDTMSKNVSIGGSWAAEKTIDLLASNIVDANLGSFFKKDISADTALTISNLLEGRTVTVVVRNSSATVRNITLPTITNSIDLVTAIPAGKFGIFKVIRAFGSLYALTPVRTEAVFG